MKNKTFKILLFLLLILYVFFVWYLYEENGEFVTFNTKKVVIIVGIVVLALVLFFIRHLRKIEVDEITGDFELYRTNQIRLKSVLNVVGQAIFIVDNEHNIIFYNDEFKKVFARTENTKIDKESFYKVTRHPSIISVVEALSKETPILEREGVIFEEDNKYIRIRGQTLVADNKEILAKVIVIEDRSKIRKLEEMRKDFVSNVTHELKTPLTSIKGFVETLKTGDINDKKTATRFLDIIDIEVERLHNLIQDILELSHIESNTKEVFEKIDLKELAEEVCEIMKASAIDKDIKILCNSEDIYFTCNADRIKQLIINLMSNGINNTAVGEVKLSIYDELGESKNVIIEVTDTGVGMNKEDKERIFERFFRVDKGRSRSYGGTGLGLSIVKHIVELYNGKISVESEVNVGTSFKIKLPYSN